MKIITKIIPVVSSLAFFTLLACGGGGGGTTPPPPPPVTETTTVEFVYMASTEIDPAVLDLQIDCANLVGETHIHPEWRGFDVVFLPPFPPSEFRISFSDVPVGINRIRVSDANSCFDNPTGATTRNVFANGVLLTNIVETPGTGNEPGLSFEVTADGTVTP